jgi:hypothetical protein
LRKTPPFRCLTSLDLLSRLTTRDAICPNAFIFNTGRCGSTLLAKVLARSRANLVLSEAAPQNQIWQTMTSPEDGVAAFRNLILAMGRKRLPSYRAHVIKFTSVNLVHFDSIRAAFPGVPSLFLFRDPAMILASYAKKGFQWKGWMGGAFGSWGGPAEAVEDLCRRALALLRQDRDFRCLEYAALTPDRLPAILEYFHMSAAPDELRTMISEFDWDARSEKYPSAFARSPVYPVVPDIPQSLFQAYRALSAVRFE